MNSFRAVHSALVFEVARQAEELDAGRRIRRRRAAGSRRGKTVSQRSKEQAHDYRYFPEPDLPPVTLDAARIDKIRAQLPELPDVKLHRFERSTACRITRRTC